MKRAVVGGLLVLVVLAAVLIFFLRGCGKRSIRVTTPTQPVPVSSPVSSSTATAHVAAKKPSQPAVARLPRIPPAPVLAPPPVKLFKELIPKNIEIVRVYYVDMIAAPGSSIAFDINGSGFTAEFKKMIQVESGQPDASVKNLALVTPNQIHGTLDISQQSATMVAFPRVLIDGKVVFQAPEPFAVIRPGDVLNLIFTELGESGRTGRFRVFTNLDQDMFSNFKVLVSTPAVQIVDLTPTLPFIVDGTVAIGPAVGGDYDVTITLKDKTIWTKDGIIRVVKPNVGQSGLIQRVQAVDAFARPGDKIVFVIQGSGFQPQDVTVLKAHVNELETVASSFTYVAPGRLELTLALPPEAPEKTYGLTLNAGSDVLQNVSDAFHIVGKNWTRALKVEPKLVPGGSSTLTLEGRDLGPEFVSKFKIELDEPDIQIGNFTLMNPQEATAPISAGPAVKSGDYLIHITSDGQPIHPQFGSIIRVSVEKP